ncbi:DUF305 domain-containing protein [Gordonia insulae]|uniref:DUF305 domain-containing protein n=1 Tax=Gordonia insulae TaxID=2420509 RepID=A0A3G8JLT4_9ACTN|nr:DUF305 domain-containing protein [Gordonia insulae]AZG46036.1 hypothetical protein D7316_02636 [Gordonia insulae]
MSGRLRLAGALGVALLMLSIGVVVGVVWQTSRADDPHRPSVTDIGFAQDMSAHHDQAILMANSLSRTVAPEITGLADRIVVAQTAETATMRGWLTWFGSPVTSDHPMSWMSTAGGHDHPGGSPQRSTPDTAPMPGMASIDELGRLSVAQGRAAEILFLQLMIRHHQGGLEMATAAYNDPRTSTTTKQFAMTMIGDQGDEIGQMTLLLHARNSRPLPA